MYMLRPLERQHDTSLYDTKRNALTPKTARLQLSPTGSSDLRTRRGNAHAHHTSNATKNLFAVMSVDVLGTMPPKDICM